MRFTSVLAVSYALGCVGILAVPITPSSGNYTVSSTVSSRSLLSARGPLKLDAEKCKARKAKGKSPPAQKQPAQKQPAQKQPTQKQPAQKQPTQKHTGHKRTTDSSGMLVALNKRSGSNLCNVNVRRPTSNRDQCRYNPAFLKPKPTGNYKIVQFGEKPGNTQHEWQEPDEWLSAHFDPYQCDHALELQISTKALEDAGFCKKLEEILGHGGIGNTLTSRIRAAAAPATNSDLTQLLNDKRMKFFLDEKLNGAKKVVVSKAIGSTQTANIDAAYKPALKQYIQMTNANGATIAKAIDQKAASVLNQAVDEAMKAAEAAVKAKHPNSPIPADEQEELDDKQCSIIAAHAEFQTGAVEAAWSKFVGEFA